MKVVRMSIRINEDTRDKLEKISKKEFRNMTGTLSALINKRYIELFGDS